MDFLNHYVFNLLLGVVLIAIARLLFWRDLQKWGVVSGMVVLIIAGSLHLQWRDSFQTTLHVPQRDLPAYHLITAQDLISTTMRTTDLPNAKHLLRTEAELVGHYTLSPLRAEKVITETQLVPSSTLKLVQGTIPLSIPATAAMAMGGQLASGAVVTLWSVPPTGTVPAEPLLPEVLVLDVLKADVTSERESSSYPYVIVLAIPKGQQVEVVMGARAETLLLTLVSN